MISGLIEHTALYRGDTEIVARTIEGKLHRFDYIAFITEMPLTATGKIHKLTLRQRFKDHRLAGIAKP